MRTLLITLRSNSEKDKVARLFLERNLDPPIMHLGYHGCGQVCLSCFSYSLRSYSDVFEVDPGALEHKKAQQTHWLSF